MSPVTRPGAALNVTPSSAATSSAAPSTAALLDCGRFVLGQGEEIQSVAAQCLIDAAGQGSRAELFVTRPTLWHYIATRSELEWRSGDVLNWAASGALKLRTEHIFPLAQAAQAQIDMEGRKTTGKILLVP